MADQSSVITVSDLLGATPSDYGHAADNLTGLLQSYEQLVAEFGQKVVSPVQSTWQGPAADSAMNSLTTLHTALQSTQQYLNNFIDLLRSGQQGIAAAQAYLYAAQELAQQHDFTITNDGTVEHSIHNIPHRMPSPDILRVQTELQNEISDLIQQAISTAKAVNDPIAEALENPTQPPGPTPDPSNEISPPTTSPNEVNAWWTNLPPNAQHQYLTTQPSRLGPLNGIPASIRDRANRSVMASTSTYDDQQITSLTSQITQLKASGEAYSNDASNKKGPKEPTSPLLNLERQLDEYQGSLAAIQNMQSELDQGDQPTYLLTFNPTGIGRAIVAIGNPDTATNVATFVPGLGTNLAAKNINSMIYDAQNITLQANSAPAQAPGATSTIMWFGYNAPQLTNLAVAGTGDATGAEQDLTTFVNSLRAVNPNILNNTLLGYSYGSLVVGEAMSHDIINVNNVILVGSPGTSVDNASQLNISPQNVWVGQSPDDPVAHIEFPFTTNEWFGQNPASPSFGANQFVTR